MSTRAGGDCDLPALWWFGGTVWKDQHLGISDDVIGVCREELVPKVSARIKAKDARVGGEPELALAIDEEKVRIDMPMIGMFQRHLEHHFAAREDSEAGVQQPHQWAN
jgi:hypothetical protein